MSVPLVIVAFVSVSAACNWPRVSINDQIGVCPEWAQLDPVTQLCWTWASPCTCDCSTISITKNNWDRVGWRFATDAEWTAFSAQFLDETAKQEWFYENSTVVNDHCSAGLFDSKFDHCDVETGDTLSNECKSSNIGTRNDIVLTCDPFKQYQPPSLLSQQPVGFDYYERPSAFCDSLLTGENPIRTWEFPCTASSELDPLVVGNYQVDSNDCFPIRNGHITTMNKFQIFSTWQSDGQDSVPPGDFVFEVSSAFEDGTASDSLGFQPIALYVNETKPQRRFKSRISCTEITVTLLDDEDSFLDDFVNIRGNRRSNLSVATAYDYSSHAVYRTFSGARRATTRFNVYQTSNYASIGVVGIDGPVVVPSNADVTVAHFDTVTDTTKLVNQADVTIENTLVFTTKITYPYRLTSPLIQGSEFFNGNKAGLDIVPFGDTGCVVDDDVLPFSSGSICEQAWLITLSASGSCLINEIITVSFLFECAIDDPGFTVCPLLQEMSQSGAIWNLTVKSNELCGRNQLTQVQFHNGTTPTRTVFGPFQFDMSFASTRVGKNFLGVDFTDTPVINSYEVMEIRVYPPCPVWWQEGRVVDAVMFPTTGQESGTAISLIRDGVQIANSPTKARTVQFQFCGSFFNLDTLGIRVPIDPVRLASVFGGFGEYNVTVAIVWGYSMDDSNTGSAYMAVEYDAVDDFVGDTTFEAFLFKGEYRYFAEANATIILSDPGSSEGPWICVRFAVSIVLVVVFVVI